MRKVSEITSAAMAQKINIDAPEGMHMHPPATATKDGFMAKEDKVKLDAATILPTANTLVMRDANGNFQVGTSTDPNGIANNASVTTVQTNLTTHINNSSVHMLPSEKTTINNHMADGTIHVTPTDKAAWNGHLADQTIHVTTTDKTNWNSKAPGSTQVDLTTHTGNVDIHTTLAEKNKLAGIASGAEVNQSAFSYVNDVPASAKTDTLFLVGGIGITVSTDPSTKRVTITATGSATPGAHASTHVTGGSDVIPNAVTNGASGLMSGADAQFVRVDGETKTGAQTKADAAKSAAISAAASDATTKANAAEASAKAYSDSKQTTSIKPLEREVANLNLQLAAASRVSNGVTFGSNFADSFGMTFDMTKTSTTAALSAGATSITVTSATGLSAGMEVTIYDDTNLERVTITSISGTTLTVPALKKAYKSGAHVARTMAVLDATNRMLKFGGWTTLITNTVTDASVVGSAYDTSGNGGRKLVRLSNGWLVAVVIQTGTQVIWEVSKDNGTTWTQLAFWTATVPTHAYLAFKGTRVYTISIGTGGTSVYGHSFDAEVVTNTNQTGLATIDSGQTAFSGATLTINDAGTELHAAWASKNATYPNSFNIRYAKGTIAADGSVTWGAVTQITNTNTTGQDNINPCIIVKSNNNPVILLQQDSSVATAGHWIMAYIYNGTAWTAPGAGIVIYSGGGSAYNQSNPSAIFVPQSINGLTSGRIWVVWHGYDSTDTTVYNIRISYSDDGGATWSAMQKLTTGNSKGAIFASVTSDKNGNVFVIYQRVGASYYDIKMIKYSSGSWGSETTLVTSSTANKANPSTLYDLSMDLTTPLFIYQDVQGAKVGFYGTWKTTGVTPIIENDIRFTVKDTSEAVLWAQRDAALTVDATINGQTMDKTTVSNEDQFVKTLGAFGKAEIRLHMTRASTSADIGMSRILGGVS